MPKSPILSPAALAFATSLAGAYIGPVVYIVSGDDGTSIEVEIPAPHAAPVQASVDLPQPRTPDPFRVLTPVATAMAYLGGLHRLG
ncbi:MAG: hypothetical protein QM756_44700 [Polyangiaceae bacterium]